MATNNSNTEIQERDKGRPPAAALNIEPAPEKLSKAELNLLNDPLIGRRAARSMLDQDGFAKDPIDDDTTPGQEKAQSNDATGPLPAANDIADDVTEQPLHQAAQNSAQSGNQRAENNKPVLSAVEEFKKVRGQTFTQETPSFASSFDVDDPDENELPTDISIDLLTGTQIARSNLKASGDLRREAEAQNDSIRRDYGYKASDYATTEYIAAENRRVSETIARLDQRIETNQRQQAVHVERIAQYEAKIKVLDVEGLDLTKEKVDLNSQVDAAKAKVDETAAKAEQAAKEATAKYNEMHPDGPTENISGDQMSEQEIAESKLRDQAYDQHRDEIKALYLKGGITEEEFAAMERGMKGTQQGDDYKLILSGADKAAAKDLPRGIDGALHETLQKTDPQNPWLKTQDAAYQNKANADNKNTTALITYNDVSENVKSRLGTIDQRLSEIERERKDLVNKTEEEKQQLEKLRIEAEQLRTEKSEAVKYQEYLNSDEVKKGLADKTLTLDDVKKHAPKFMDDAGKLEAATPATTPAAAVDAQSTSRVATSASGSGIDAESATEKFNLAASATPALQAPVPAIQKPVPVAQPGMAV